MKIIDTIENQIFFGDHDLAFSQWLEGKSFSALFALIDANVYKLWQPTIEQLSQKYSLKTLVIEANEKHKTIQTCQKIWTWLLTENADRHSILFNIGGGIVGDVGGFAAASFKRGIGFVQIPTTLLSQVDASIGGKVGVNFGGLKNSIGSFSLPKAIFLDTKWLHTLPEREWRSGFAEVIKHALINDLNLWKEILKIKNISSINWKDLLPKAIMVKNKIVALDPLEKADRKALNFGHTIGHALESIFIKSKSPLLHGEAVAIGMVCESFISNQKTGLSDQELKEISNFILKKYPKKHITKKHFKLVEKLVLNDKKNKNGQINYTLLSSIGAYKIDQSCSAEMMEQSLIFYNEFL